MDDRGSCPRYGSGRQSAEATGNGSRVSSTYEYEGPAAGPADIAAVQDMPDRSVHHL